MEYSSDKSNNNISIPQFPYKQTNSKRPQSIIYWHKNFWFDFVRQSCPTLILILLTACVCRHTRTSWIAKVANNLNWIALLKKTLIYWWNEYDCAIICRISQPFSPLLYITTLFLIHSLWASYWLKYSQWTLFMLNHE